MMRPAEIVKINLPQNLVIRSLINEANVSVGRLERGVRSFIEVNDYEDEVFGNA